MIAIPSPGSKPSENSKTWLICGLLALSIVAAYWPVMGYAFTDYDDKDYVRQNPHVLNGLNWPDVVWAFIHFYASNWHPLTWLSHMLDVQLFGLNAGGHHVTSVLFHASDTVLLFLCLSQATGFLWRSAMVAALFGLHPLHVESVAWVAERKDVLSTFFFLLTLMAYTRYVKQARNDECQVRGTMVAARGCVVSPFYWLALFCFAFGLMSKPMLVTLPFVLLLLDYWPLNRIRNSEFGIRNSISLLMEKIPFFALSAGSCVITYFAQQSGNAVMTITIMPVDVRIQNALISYRAYLHKMLWPHALAVCYPLQFPINTDQAVMAFFILLLISSSVFSFRRRRPFLITGWLWYLGTLVPVIGLVQVGGQAMADRYTYVPSIGVFIALIWLVAEISIQWPCRRWLLGMLSACVLSSCWVLTAAQVHYWQNSETLSRHALAVTPDNAAMQILLGNALREEGKAEEAGQHFAEAARIWPNTVAAQFSLALVLVELGKLDEAIDYCQAALKIQPHDTKIHYLLGNTFSSQGKWAEAIAEYKAVLQIEPDHLFALNDLAWLLATASDPHFRDGSEAVQLAEKACQLSNYQVTKYVGTLAAAYAEAGRFADAVKTGKIAISLAAAAKNERLAQKNRELLELYQLKRAYHEPAIQ
jgi:cytochrome c-type biogenesis protein CcmH/NrfG